MERRHGAHGPTATPKAEASEIRHGLEIVTARVQSTDSAAVASRTGNLPVAALAATWLTCGFLLWRMWAFEVDRYYGFSVFPLAAYLLLLRWETFPPARLEGDAIGRTAWTALGAIGALLIGLCSVVLASNPLWTAVAWLACLGALLTSLGLIGGIGGPGWAARSLFPLGFAFTALPWPAIVQVPVVRMLRQFTAETAANLVSWAGRPVVAHGSVIETAQGWIGVDEACSGIVGLQTALMLGLFFGELRGLRLSRRVILVGASVALALTANVARAAWLTWHGAGSGAADLAAWHDTAAFAELALVALGVVSISLCFHSPHRLPQTPRTTASRAATLIPILVIVTLLGSLIATECWYRLPGAPIGREVKWTLTAPSPAWRTMTLAAGIQEHLHYDAVTHLAWHDPATGRDWIALHLSWDTDPALRYEPSLHAPEICLPASGAELETLLEPSVVEIDGISLTLRPAKFRGGGEAFYTFSCLWDAWQSDVLDVTANAAVGMPEGRLQMIRERRRHLGLEQITLVLNRCHSEAEALELVRAMAPRLLHR